MHASKRLLKPEVQKRVAHSAFVVAGVLGCSLGAAMTALMALQFVATSKCELVDARDLDSVQAPRFVPVPIQSPVEAPKPAVAPPAPANDGFRGSATGRLKHVVSVEKPLLIISASVSLPQDDLPIHIHHSDDIEHVLTVPVNLARQPLTVQKLIGKRVALFSQAGRCEAKIDGLVAAHWIFADSGPKSKKDAADTFSSSSAFLAATLDLTDSCGKAFVGGVILDDGVHGHAVRRFDLGPLDESSKLYQAAVARAKMTDRSNALQAEFAANEGKGEWSGESFARVIAIGGKNPSRVIVSFSSEGCGAFEGVNVVEYEVNDGVLGKERMLPGELNVSSIGLALDVNNDGDPDILSNDDWSANASVFVSDGSGGYDLEQSGTADYYFCRC